MSRMTAGHLSVLKELFADFVPQYWSGPNSAPFPYPASHVLAAFVDKVNKGFRMARLSEIYTIQKLKAKLRKWIRRKIASVAHPSAIASALHARDRPNVDFAVMRRCVLQFKRPCCVANKCPRHFALDEGFCTRQCRYEALREAERVFSADELQISETVIQDIFDLQSSLPNFGC
jgi:hypothetical protein